MKQPTACLVDTTEFRYTHTHREQVYSYADCQRVYLLLENYSRLFLTFCTSSFWLSFLLHSPFSYPVVCKPFVI